MHVNQQVRQAFATALGTVPALATVSSSRGAPLLDDDMPAAVIQTPRDVVELATKEWADAPQLERRVIETYVVIVISGETMETVDDEMDALRASIEAVIEVGGTLSGLAHRVEHVGAETDIRDDEDGEFWYGFMTLQWQIEVWTEAGDPETAVAP